jgi:oxygen-independent coproporphyrinogen III oxidase
MFKFNMEKYKKYNVPGPRYTSYPTALQFNPSFTYEDYFNEIRLSREDTSQDLSLYFHLPFCDTLCYFCGCNMIITRNRDRIRKYLDYLKREIDLVKKYAVDGKKVIQLHWGGGTPTHLSPEEIHELASYIKDSFSFKDNSEVSCEIDPRELTREHLAALRENGFNRISLGVQDFDAKVQEAVNRVQPEVVTNQTVEWIRDLKFLSMNIDLMYGLPFQTIESFNDTLDKIIKISPERIAVFNYAHVPWMKKHMGLINAEDLPSAETKLNILQLTIEKLTVAGYVFIGMDHFAKPDDELAIALKEKKMYRNFQGYSTYPNTDLFAMGITGISQVKSVFAQNYKTENEYFDALDKDILPTARGYQLTFDDTLRRFVIMRLMCDFELKFASVDEKFNINFKEYFNKELNSFDEMKIDGLVELSDNKIEVTEMGRLLIRNIAMKFDAYIDSVKEVSKYSKTI